MPRADGLRLAVTTLSVLPARGPAALDRRLGGAAMLWAPAVGLALAVPVAALLIGARTATGDTSLLPPVLAVALLALLTRGLHLDGLADTVDGLGSYRRGDEALAVMRRGDSGPLGVAAVVLVLLADCAALQVAVAEHQGTVAAVAALVSGRLALTVSCRTGAVAAPGSRLGAVVIGTVPPLAAAAVVGLAVVACGAVALLDPHAPHHRAEVAQALLAPLVAVAVTSLLGRHANRRLGGLTGDVLGAQVELAQLVALVVLATGANAPGG